ncbi:MAG: hypothetical protein DI536_36135 [Archangium gephyra]|uniref:Uncharacterized protein n=1 Tax=Archangium gephyra TaxID=48 RepID=A0A2W5U3P4_9BACT|nr:MAG: hypothetical protein DI536_36135 [Archangium gephyra]
MPVGSGERISSAFQSADQMENATRDSWSLNARCSYSSPERASVATELSSASIERLPDLAVETPSVQRGHRRRK